MARMARTLAAVLSAAAVVSTYAQASEKWVGAYWLVDSQAPAKLQALAANAATLPVTRIWISFFMPDLVYEADSRTLCTAGLNYSTTGDCGFVEVAGAVATLQAAGVEVFLSMGGWNGNCMPYAYAYYSVGGYGTQTPNYYKIAAYGGLSGCTEETEYCYVCEPPYEDPVSASNRRCR
jgi:hypothetical protein